MADMKMIAEVFRDEKKLPSAETLFRHLPEVSIVKDKNRWLIICPASLLDRVQLLWRSATWT